MAKDTENPVKFLLLDTYLSYIKNAVGSRMFQDVFVEVAGKKVNATGNGQTSCAAFVSALLVTFGLLAKSHATVASTVKDMEQLGWYKINEPVAGAVILWEQKLIAGASHAHVGFYIGDDQAVSNSWEKRVPVKHHWTFGEENGRPVRKVEALYWHDRLKN